MALQRYGARLCADRPWAVDVTVPGRDRPLSCKVLVEGNALVPADIDRALGDMGFVRTGSIEPGDLVDGAEFDVLDFSPQDADPDGPSGEQAAAALALARGTRAVIVSIPACEADRVRETLAEVLGRGNREGSWSNASLRFVAHSVDAATVDVVLPASLYERALGALERAGAHSMDEARRGPIQRLVALAGQARLSTGPWPAPRDALQAALRQALAQPGAEGLAVRDELLDVVGRFVAAHRTATRADDAEQQRLQAERDGLDRRHAEQSALGRQAACPPSTDSSDPVT
ncbi:hypothetical protein G6045_20785 [Streptomyces sp. YC504]|uniref:Uncharacterized protein n=1 Tax=Streptomyces mesophilus TaxID=1775132 RepID=A0A6G4XMN7_9ACTN|nr:hypothetical protein [Streptomyces mesophilus]NGO78080.1 hypothetical protein [Streptomyces mesophilus]